MAPERQLQLGFTEEAAEPEVLQQLLTPDEIYARAESIAQQIAEDRRIERKARIQPAALADNFSMWANTSPDGGLIAVGISNDGQIPGCKALNQKTINELEAGPDKCPQARFESKRVSVINRDGEPDFFILFRVFYHPSRLVETTDHKVFVRRGDKKIEIRTDQEKRQLRIDKGEIRFEQEPCGLEFPGDFDMDLIRAFIANVRKARGLQHATSDTKILTALRLGSMRDEVFRPNVACALLFSIDPVSVVPGCKIHFLRYEGVEAKGGTQFNETANMPPIEGPIPRQIEQISALLRDKIRKFSDFGKDGKFHTTPEYPEEAWYEAIVNACVHRSYVFENMKVFVRMFDDRLEIESPGPFPPGVNAQSIYHIQHSRNPYLAEAMRYLGFVREIGEGAPRIRDSMLRLGLPEPEFSQREVDSAKVQVTLRNNIAFRKRWVDSDVAALIGASITRSLSENEKIVLNYVVVHGSINVSEAGRLTGHNWPTSRKVLMGLVEKRILRYVHRESMPVDRKAHFVLSEPFKPAERG